MPETRPLPRPTEPPPDPESAYDAYGDEGVPSRPQPDRTKRLALDLLGRWHWIALGLILGGLGAFYYLSKAPKLYHATVTMLVKERTGTIMQKGMMPDEIDMRSIEAMNTVVARIMRPELMESVASRQDVRALPGLMPKKVNWWPEWTPMGRTDPAATAEAAAVPPPGMLAGAIGSWTKVSVRKNTRLLDLTVEHPVPEVAKAVADAVAREYVAELIGNRSQGQSSEVALLMQSAKEARTNLQAAQSSLAIYQRALGVQEEMETQETAAGALARRYLPKHPKMIAASGQLAALKKRFLDEFTAARNSPADKAYWESVATQLDSSTNPEEQLNVTRRLLVARATVLQSEITSQNSVFNGILTRIQEADVNQQSAEAEVDISSLARKPGMPTSPVLSRVVTAGIASGLAFGLALALLFRWVDNKFHTVAQTEAETGLPVLAGVAEISKRAVAVAARRGKAVETPETQQWDRRIVFRGGVSKTSYAEMFRVLRTSISLLGDERQRQITLFSSALPGEGKTMVSTNFALAAAQQGRRTLLLDMDLRKPSLHKIFGMKRDDTGPGITRLLAGQATLAEAASPLAGEPNLHVIFSGPKAPSPGELLNTKRLRELFAEARELYDVVVLDTAPLLAVPDTRLLAPLVDNLCLVVRAEYVPIGAVQRTLELLASANTPPAGIVFNAFHEHRHLMGYNYSYGYYRTNRYGSGYRYGYGHYGAYGDKED